MLTSKKAGANLEKELIKRISNVGLGFRIYPDKEGNEGSKLILKLDTKKPYDQTIESHGVNIFLDPKYSRKLKNMELDYVEGPTGGFVLKEHSEV
jgi:Fe-S cluster assembly iron-binding protein IscA